MLRPGVRRLAALTSLLVCLCCAPIEVRLEPASRARPSGGATPPSPGPRELLAGASEVDITPLPGFPLAGHAFDGGTAIGVWTPLEAHAIYIEDSHQRPFVLVSCDLWAMPAGLADAVAERVRSHPGMDHIERSHLLIAATHTHHSPGNFSTARTYNMLAAPKPGFDPELFDFLTERIALAIVEAANAKRPASATMHSRRPSGLARNRSPGPFSDNPEAEGILTQNRDIAGCPRPEDAVDRCRAIDPTLTVLRIDPAGAKPKAPIAIAAFFATHPTVLTDDVDLFQADMYGIASETASRGFAVPPVVAIFNGAEGDVSPHWHEHGRAETERLGTELGREITSLSLARGRPLTDPAIEHRTSIVGLSGVSVGEGRTPRRALAGRAVLGGASDGRTKLYRPPPGKTVTRERRAGHGPKKPVFPPMLVHLILSRRAVPERVPISVHQLGPLRFVGLPGEFTTVLGLRIKQGLAQELGQAPEPPPILLVGLADEYMSYFTTPEEYARQHYEGASTLWGTHSGTLIVNAISNLADSPGSSTREPPHTARYWPGPRRSWALSRGARARRLTEHAPERIAEQLGLGAESVVRFDVRTSPPRWRSASTHPQVFVEASDEARSGSSARHSRETVTFVRGITRSGWDWTVLWIPTAEDLGHAYRLRVRAPDGTWRCSKVFELGAQAHPRDVLVEAPCVERTNDRIDARDHLG